jgi:ATP-dependent protease HslVU (ClpYQ) peptidase subunit
MSTITIARKNGQVAIAADTLTMWGSIRESSKYVANPHKIISVENTYIGIAGPASGKMLIQESLLRMAGEGVTPDFSSPSAIFKTWLRIHKEMKDSLFLNTGDEDDSSVETSQMDVLIANPHGIFMVDAYRSVQEYTRFYACGAGLKYALGAMYAIYDNDAFSAEEVARYGVEAAAEFNDSTALPVISFTIALQTEEIPF